MPLNPLPLPDSVPDPLPSPDIVTGNMPAMTMMEINAIHTAIDNLKRQGLKPISLTAGEIFALYILLGKLSYQDAINTGLTNDQYWRLYQLFRHIRRHMEPISVLATAQEPSPSTHHEETRS
jgi:hypothetical protein